MSQEFDDSFFGAVFGGAGALLACIALVVGICLYRRARTRCARSNFPDSPGPIVASSRYFF